MPQGRYAGNAGGKKVYISRADRAKKPSNKSLQKAVAKSNALGHMVEYYYHENQPARTLSLIGNVDSCIAVAEGDTSLTRSGLKITPASMLVRIRTKANSIATQGALARYMLVRDKQQVSDTTPSVGEIIETTGLRVLSPLSRLFRDRFDVLWDKVVKVSAAGAYGDVHYFSKFTKLPSTKPVYFNGTAGTDIQKNVLYLVSITDEGTNSPQMFAEFRLRYADL